MWFGIFHRLCRLLVIVAYTAATAVGAATLPLAACPGLDMAAHPVTHHDHGHQHHNGSDSKADECLKCCVGSCLVAPGLPRPNAGVSELAFAEVPVLYWGVLSVIVGDPVAPDPGPPKPIA